jgi:hypothetical protein
MARCDFIRKKRFGGRRSQVGELDTVVLCCGSYYVAMQGLDRGLSRRSEEKDKTSATNEPDKGKDRDADSVHRKLHFLLLNGWDSARSSTHDSSGHRNCRKSIALSLTL